MFFFSFESATLVEVEDEILIRALIGEIRIVFANVILHHPDNKRVGLFGRRDIVVRRGPELRQHIAHWRPNRNTFELLEKALYRIRREQNRRQLASRCLSDGSVTPSGRTKPWAYGSRPALTDDYSCFAETDGVHAGRNGKRVRESS